MGAGPGTAGRRGAGHVATERCRVRRVRGGRRAPLLGELQSGHRRASRVRYFQAWTEPNLPYHLSPQWIRAGRALGRGEPDHLPRTSERLLPSRQVGAFVERGDHGRDGTLRGPAGRPADAARPFCARSSVPSRGEAHSRALSRSRPLRRPRARSVFVRRPDPARILGRRRLDRRHVEADPGARGRRANRPGAPPRPSPRLGDRVRVELEAAQPPRGAR